MEPAAQRRQTALLAEKKRQIVVKSFRLVGARRDHQHRPLAIGRRESQQIGARAALDALNALAARPGSAQELSELFAERKIGHRSVMKRG